MADHEKTVVDAIEAREDDNPLVQSVTIDGQTVRMMSAGDQIALAGHHRRRLARKRGKRPFVAQLRLDQAW